MLLYNVLRRVVPFTFSIFFWMSLLFAACLAVATDRPAMAVENCQDCHGYTASDFQLAPVDRAVACKRCHYIGPHNTGVVQTGSGWFTSAESANVSYSILHDKHKQLTQFGYYCSRCHGIASCGSCHNYSSVPHRQHGSAGGIVQPVTKTTAIGVAYSSETFYCGSGSCHGIMPSINRNDCSSCHTVGMAGHEASPRTHSDFTNSTAACASCHVTHYAWGAKLLQRENETELCYLCHGAGASATPFNVEEGLTYNSASSQWVASTAGGFLASGGMTSTSRHNVAGYDQGNDTTFEVASPGFTGVIPGGESELTGGGLLCSSCHSPHGGTGNARLLRASFFNGVSGKSVRMTTGSNLVLAYDKGFSEWCASCHERFNKSLGSGHTAENFNGYMIFRHAVNARIAVPSTVDDASMAGTPLQSGKQTSGTDDDNLLICSSCHRSHGTASLATGWGAGWPREVDPGGGATGEGSALLRMNNRGICFNCHGAAERNLP